MAEKYGGVEVWICVEWKGWCRITNQEKKHYLQRYTVLNAAVNQKLLERDKLRALAEKCTPSITDMPRGGAGGREDIYIRLAELDGEIGAEIKRCVDARREVEAAIDTVGDTTLRALLRHRYLDGMTWEQVAVEIGRPFHMTKRKLHLHAVDRVIVD